MTNEELFDGFMYELRYYQPDQIVYLAKNFAKIIFSKDKFEAADKGRVVYKLMTTLQVGGIPESYSQKVMGLVDVYFGTYVKHMAVATVVAGAGGDKYKEVWFEHVPDKKIEAIKLLREFTNVPLKEAMDLVSGSHAVNGESWAVFCGPEKKTEEFCARLRAFGFTGYFIA